MPPTASTMLELGTIAPDFSLPDVVNGVTVHRNDSRGKSALLVFFISPHCPFVKHIERALGSLGRDYADKPLGIVAINSNDIVAYPQDGPEAMRLQAVTQGFTFPYLFDESQEAAKAYQAACTPDFFLFDANFKLVYRGQFDASRPKTDIPVTGEDLREAIDDVLQGNPTTENQIASLGCNIKWKA